MTVVSCTDGRYWHAGRAQQTRSLADPPNDNPVAPTINRMVDRRRRSAMLNHMVEDNSAALDRVFRALASGPRREILRRAARGRCTVTGLAEHFDMSLAAVAKHVRVLDEARLLVQTREGRENWRRFNPASLEPARASIEELRGFWTEALDGLERYLAGQPPAPRRGRHRRRAPR